jgi:hypothetical protein
MDPGFFEIISSVALSHLKMYQIVRINLFESSFNEAAHIFGV